MVSGWRKAVRQIQSRESSKRRRTILLLLGEKAGMREVVNHLKSEFRRGNGSRWLVARSLAMTEIRLVALKSHESR